MKASDRQIPILKLLAQKWEARGRGSYDILCEMVNADGQLRAGLTCCVAPHEMVGRKPRRNSCFRPQLSLLYAPGLSHVPASAWGNQFLRASQCIKYRGNFPLK